MADDTYVQAIRYEADIADVQKKLNDLANKQNETEGKTKDSTTKMSKHWDGVKDSVGKIAAGIGLLGGAAILMAPKILEGGASLEALDTKAKTVFEGSLGKVDAWSAANAKAMGLTKTEATAAAASIADLLKPMGFTADAAAGMSTDMMSLSGALSAWSGGQKSAAEVSDIITKAMLGETDGLKGLGISISAADVEARLAKNGTQDLTGAALEQAKAVAVQQLIMEKSTDAQKAWGDGSMDAVKKQNSMKASVGTLQESFTKALYPALSAILPIVSSLADWLGQHLPGAIATLKGWITGAAQWLGEHKEILIIVAGIIAGVLVGAFVAWATAAWAAAAASLAAAAPFIAIGAAIAVVAAGIIYAYTHFEIFRTVVDTVKNFILNDLIPAAEKVWAVFKTLVEIYIWPLVEAFKLIKTTITDFVLPAFSAIIDTISTVGTKVSGIVSGIVSTFTELPGKILGALSTLGRDLLALAGTAVGLFWDGFTGALDASWHFISGLPGKIVGELSGIGSDLADKFSKIPGAIWSAFKTAWNAVADFTTFHIPQVTIPMPPGVPDIHVGGGTVSLLPHLHSGGVVPGPTGAEVLTVLKAGETVRTTQQEAALGRGGGPVVHGNIIIQTNESAKHWYDESLWRVAG